VSEPVREPCWKCDGEGCTFAVYGQLDTYETCTVCAGTGLRPALRSSVLHPPVEEGS
jgi:DnaJ-class molecular chaperone